MGRGSSSSAHATAGATLRGGGEIASLYDNPDREVTSLDSVSAQDTAVRAARVMDDEDRADQRAIRALAAKLRQRNPGMDSDTLTEKATDLYVGLCRKVQSGQANEAAVAQFAALIDEQPDELVARLQRAFDELDEFDESNPGSL